MKRRIRAMALLAALTLLCGCGKKEAQPQQEDVAVNIVPVEGVTALELCDGEVTLRFARTDDTWHWVDDGTFPLDQDAVAALLALPSSLAAAEPVQGQGELSGYGLETPKKYVTATADGAAAVCGLDVPEAILAVNYVNAHGGDGALTLTVGGSTGDGGRYVTLNGDATIYRMEETGLAQVLTLAALGLS